MYFIVKTRVSLCPAPMIFYVELRRKMYQLCAWRTMEALQCETVGPFSSRSHRYRDVSADCAIVPYT